MCIYNINITNKARTKQGLLRLYLFNKLKQKKRAKKKRPRNVKLLKNNTPSKLGNFRGFTM